MTKAMYGRRKAANLSITRDNKVSQIVSVDTDLIKAREIQQLLPTQTHESKQAYSRVLTAGYRRGNICVLCGEQSMTRVVDGYCIDVSQCEKNASYLDAEAHGITQKKGPKGPRKNKTVDIEDINAQIQALLKAVFD